MSILSQINLIINRFYLTDDYSITDYYYDLRRRTVAWLKACNKNINREINIHHHLKLHIPKMHRHFFIIISQNRDYFQTFAMIE